MYDFFTYTSLLYCGKTELTVFLYSIQQLSVESFSLLIKYSVHMNISFFHCFKKIFFVCVDWIKDIHQGPSNKTEII